MNIASLMEVLSAAHLSVDVESPFPVRGGIMLVAPPASLKSTVVKEAIEGYPNALLLSDINVQQLIQIRDSIASRRVLTLAFPELEKLYQRRGDTATNIEGHIKAMVEEGFRHGYTEDQRLDVREARCLVIGGMTSSMYRRKMSEWLEDGFARRFLWCHFSLSDPHVLMQGIHEWRRISLTDQIVAFAVQPGVKIPYTVNEKESARIWAFLGHKPDYTTPFILLKKILCVLRWRYRDARAWDILEDFSQCLVRGGADVSLDSGAPISIVRPDPRPHAHQPHGRPNVDLRHQAKLAKLAKAGRK